jgi:hypothetical protein
VCRVSRGTSDERDNRNTIPLVTLNRDPQSLLYKKRRAKTYVSSHRQEGREAREREVGEAREAREMGETKEAIEAREAKKTKAKATDHRSLLVCFVARSPYMQLFKYPF